MAGGAGIDFIEDSHGSVVKITLREAHRIEKKLNAALSEPIQYHQTLSVFSNENPKTWFALALDKTTGDLSKHITFLVSRHELRMLIQRANAETRINNLVATRKHNLDCLAFYKKIKDLYEQEKVYLTSEILEAKQKAKLAKATTSTTSFYSGSEDTITVFTVSEEHYKDALLQIEISTRSIDIIEDDLANLNATVQMEVPVFVMENLRKLRLV